MTEELHLLINTIKQNGYREITPIEKDEFGRFHGIISDLQGNKFFVKAVIGKESYGYKSLRAEARVTRYLSTRTKKTSLKYNGYRLQIPRVEKVINYGGILCLISRYIKGKRLLDEPSYIQAEMLSTTLELVTQLSDETRRSMVQQYLKNYTRRALLLNFPLKLLKAIILSPFATAGLVLSARKVLQLLRIDSYDCGLIHADVNASNILIYKKTIYLTDWEEAGWGITAYNTIAPLCVHWQDRLVRERLLLGLNDKGLKRIIVPLLAYRILTLFNQNIDRKNIKRIRDLKLLKFVAEAYL